MSPAAPLLVTVGLLAQAAVLVRLADLAPRAGATLVAGAALAAAIAGAAWPRLAPAARASLVMLAGGGFGMTLGWWGELGFTSAAAWLRAAPESTAWCGLAPATPGAHLGPVHALLSWMNAGMLAAGVLAMRGARVRQGAACGRGALALDAIAMVVGMSGGAALASRLAPGASPAAAVVGAHALMNAGMLAGMQVVALARIAGPVLPAPPPPGRGAHSRAAL
jgi:hypothetical protein